MKTRSSKKIDESLNANNTTTPPVVNENSSTVNVEEQQDVEIEDLNNEKDQIEEIKIKEEK